MKKAFALSLIASLVFTGILCKKSKVEFGEEYFDPRLSGGASTVFLSNGGVFEQVIPGLSPWDAYVHEVGDKLFGQTFVSAPAPHFGGLGTVYNNVSCFSCHQNDGKGVPTAGLITSGLLTRLSIPGMDSYGGPLDVPGYGTQMQDKATFGKVPEAKLNIAYEDQPFTYPDGSTVTLRKPIYSLVNKYLPMPANVMVSVRMGPPIFGLGLLELIPESTLMAFADEFDADGDGISGRPNIVWNPATKRKEMGRFGQKANNPSLLIQIAGAFQQDIGITSSVFPQESAHGQSQDDGLNLPPEITDSMLNATVFYVQTLAVPARREVDNPQVISGEKIFRQLNCSGCHIPSMKTGVDVRLTAMSNQRIQPFTDLLLHDMGPGLADNRPDFLATGSEWKTPALWGLGLLLRANGTSVSYLHDGRARTIEEAILWHGGEAERARNGFTHLSSSDRKALLKFLSTL